MKFLRCILGKTRRERIQNTKVREILKFDKIKDEIEDSKIRWYGHINPSVLAWHMGRSPGDVSEEPVMKEKQRKGWRMSCDVGEATEGLENEL